MDHWFDRLSKVATQVGASRREVLRGAAHVTLGRIGAAFVPAFLGASDVAFAQGTCSGNLNPGTLDLKFEATGSDRRRRRLVMTGESRTDFSAVVPERPPRGKVFDRTTLTMRVGGQLARRMQIEANVDLTNPNQTIVKVEEEFGAPIRGIRRASFAITGSSGSGVIDGRRVAPFVVSEVHNLSDLRFTDGRGPPAIRVDPDLAGALEHFRFQSINPVLRECTFRDTRGGRRSSPTRFAQSSIVVADSSPIRLAMISTAQQKACSSCIESIKREWAICLSGVAAAAAATLGLGALAAGGCALEYGGRLAYCLISTDNCCPVWCFLGDPTQPGDGCCDAGETCVDSFDRASRGGCCPNERMCAGQCCPEGSVCSNGICCGERSVACNGQCCPPEYTCAGYCCPPGATVCSGVCCAGGTCDANGVCCDNAGYLCNGVCCSQFRQCCNGVCCSSDSAQCRDGACCSGERVCGPVCCPEGQVCDSARGMCVSIDCGSGLVRCDALNADGTTTPMCCPDGTKCCAGRCCEPGYTCCSPIGGNDPFGCWPSSSCIR